jgi:hypothetical protein
MLSALLVSRCGVWGFGSSIGAHPWQLKGSQRRQNQAKKPRSSLSRLLYYEIHMELKDEEEHDNRGGEGEFKEGAHLIEGEIPPIGRRASDSLIGRGREQQRLQPTDGV